MTDIKTIDILLVEDDPAHAESIRRAFLSSGTRAEIRVVGTLREYREQVTARVPDIVVLDFNLPDGKATDVLISPPEDGPFPILLNTSYGDERIAVSALKAGALDYIVKSSEAFAAMPRSVERALREWTLLQERKRAVAALQDSEARYRLLVENANDAIIVAQDGLLKFVNRTAVEMIGYSETELISRPFPAFIHPDDREKVVGHYRKRLAGDTDQPRYTFRLSPRDGGVKWVEIGAVLIDWDGRPATLNFLTDITERHKAEETIQASLREKEVMLREIHHRVKNNMQVISSLFNLQAGHTLNAECREILKEGQTRIRSMSLVHEKLYQSRDLSKIDLAGYIQSLAVHLFQVYLAGPGRVRLDTEFEDVALDINSAIPCGLILNELISNALKHAFPDGRTGAIKIGLRRGIGDAIELLVADDGIGFPEALDFRKAESFGLQIVNLLVDQLEATIGLDRTNGTALTLTFRELKYAPRI